MLLFLEGPKSPPRTHSAIAEAYLFLPCVGLS